MENEIEATIQTMYLLLFCRYGKQNNQIKLVMFDKTLVFTLLLHNGLLFSFFSIKFIDVDCSEQDERGDDS